MIGERIKTLRKSKGKSQAEFAEDMNVTQRTISNWENEERIPTLESILELTEYFSVTSDYLLGITDVNGQPMLTDDERKLLERYRACDEEGKECVLSEAMKERRRTVAAASQESAAQ